MYDHLSASVFGQKLLVLRLEAKLSLEDFKAAVFAAEKLSYSDAVRNSEESELNISDCLYF